MPDENTHGMIVAAAAQAAAGELLIGQIILPADGPWLIHDVFGQIASVTHTTAESVGGYMRIRAASGDVTPNPAPSVWPVAANGSGLLVTGMQLGCALHKYPVLWEAPGRATIQFLFNNISGTAAAPQVVLGVLFGKTVPEIKRFLYCDQVQALINSAADTLIGTITLPEKATKITGVMGILAQDGLVVTAEELLGFFRLESDDINLAPSQFPFPLAFSAGLGAQIDPTPFPPLEFIPVDIPIVGGARIDCFCDLNTAVTTPANVQVFLAFE